MPTRDVFDYITAAVGLSGILSSVVTLWLLKRQAGEMSQQVKAMDVQARTMEGQLAVADKTLVLQFRPRIMVRGARFDQGRVHFMVVNTGGSLATIKKKFRSSFVNLDQHGCDPYFGDFLGTQVELEKVGAGESTYLFLDIRPEIATAINDEIENARHFPSIKLRRNVYWIGGLRYQDELGIERSVGIFRSFDAHTSRFIPEETGDADFAD